MRHQLKKILLPLLLLFAVINLQAQYPGGVSSGTTRGYKVDYYNGTFTDQTQFGAGTANAVPGNSGYTNKVTGTEFVQLDGTYYGLEYTGILNIGIAGTYTFTLGNVDDRAWLFIDGVQIAQAVFGAAVGSQTVTYNLTAGDHAIKVKTYNGGGAASTNVQIANGPSGSNITTATNVDGRFVRYENAKLTAWYKADNLTLTAGNPTGFVNKAPDYVGKGNLSRTGTGSSGTNSTTLVNFNAGVRFDGDDRFRALTTQQPGLSYRGATKTMFMVNQYVSNVGQTDAWMFFHGDAGASQRIGFWKANTSNQLAVVGSGNGFVSAYTANEPKLLTGFVGQDLGGTASATLNPLTMGVNGAYSTATNHASNADAETEGLVVGAMNAANFPEAIYYPFELSENERQRVNSYLATKYGISLTHDYLSAASTIVYSQATNVGYTNRIFGVAREDVQGLYQKQSQSQMAGTGAGYNFLTVSKGAIATTNVANTGTLTNGSFLLLGDNNGALTAQNTEIPTSFSVAAGCTVNRLGREWKAQVTGTPGAMTFRAGFGTSIFPGNASGITMLIDRDGNGDFTNGTVDAIPATSIVNGVATFDNVTINNGDVITYVWTVIAPGGVSNGLKLWAKADDASLLVGNVSQWNDLSPNLNHLTRTPSNGVRKEANIFNYNPAIRFGETWQQNLQSISPLGMNGSNTFAEFYVLRGIGVSGLAFNEIITLGGGNHRWENNTTNFTTGKYGIYGNGVAQSAGTGSLTMGQLGLYNSTHNAIATLLRVNAETVQTRNTTEALSLSGNFRIGTDIDGSDSNSNYNSFYSPELIVYSVSLSEADIAKVNTYLSVKYSIPLANGTTDYVSSNGSIIWPTNATYKNDIFGIGRDDCSGLIQKQSTAWRESATNNLVVALGSLAATNEANTSSFAANNQFLMVGHDGGALTPVLAGTISGYTSCNANRYARTWKSANTGNVTGVQLRFGSTAFPIQSNWTNVQLAIDTDGDGNFSTGTVNLVSPSSVNGGVATFNNVTLPDAAVFTLVYTVGFPGGVSSPAVGTDINGVNHINGLEYKLYTTNGALTRNLITTPFGSTGDALVGTGYYHNATSFQNFVSQKLTTNFGIELSGKLNVTTASATYQFRAVTPDDQFALIIDGVQQPLNVTTFPGVGISVTSGNINLTAGYHDIIIRGGQGGGGVNFNLQWNNGSGTGFGSIPDANFFTVAKGPSAWYAADDALLSASADGAALNIAGNNTWNDLSGNGNTVTTAGVDNPTYYKTNSSQIRNYNPVVVFTDDRMRNLNYLKGFSYGKQSRSLIAVSSMFASGAVETLTGYGRDSNVDTDFVFFKNAANNLALRGWAADLISSTGIYGATRTTNILEGIYENGNITTTNNARIYTDYKLNVQGNRTTWNTTFNDNSQLDIGNSPDIATANGWDGSYAEIMYYPWALSAVERQKIDSYLAIKWGTTLDQTVATNYIASDGSVVWNAATAGTFKNDITVIGRDDCGALNQKQSTSTDGDDIVSLGLGSAGLAVNNQENANSFTADKTFMSIAHNGVSVNSNTTANIPASLGSCYYRLQREWQVQKVGNSGSISIELGKNGLLSINAATYKPVLLISNIAGDYTAATIVNYDEVRAGKAYFNNVALTNGQYFTLGYINATPGGVDTNMTVWFNSDFDSFSDIGQTTYVQNDGDKVASINNIKFGATFSKVEQSNVAYQPTYYKSAFNYNSGILFDGVDDVMRSVGNINTTDYRTASQMTSVFTGYNLGAVDRNVFWYHDNNAGAVKTALERPQAFWSSITSLPRTPTLTDPEIYSFLNTDGTTNGYRLLSNLKTVGQSTTNNTATTNGVFRIGSNSLSGGANPARFYLGEFVIYSDDKGAANSYDMKRIHSYMATKYGFTLDFAAMGGSYIASNGTVTYDYATHWNRITGIGMDDCSALDQKQSFSQVVSGGALVKISNDPTGLAASNKENPAEFTVDRSFLLFGDDNGALSWTDQDGILFNAQSIVRLSRTWRVKETGTVGTVYLEVPDNASALSTKLPAVQQTVYLLVSNTNDFTTPVAVKEMTLNGTDWSVNYDFTNGQYYTFATLTTCLAPAGLSDGLTTWYRADNKALGTLATMNDETANHTLTGVGGTRNVVPATRASNFNRVLELRGGGYFQKTGLNETAITAADQGTLFGVHLGTNAARLFGLTRSLNNTVQLITDGTPAAELNNGTTINYPSNATVGPFANVANILNVHFNPSEFVAGRNGWDNAALPNTAGNLTPSTSLGLRIGASYSGSTLAFGNNDFLEAFSYNRLLSPLERSRLRAYLAIKNGQTLIENYHASDNTIIYNIYDGYNNRVFGVGRHIAGCLTQNQSNSVLPGSMLQISVDGAMLAENSQDSTPWGEEDRVYVLMGDNNGSLAWNTTNMPAKLATNTCANRITRAWKVTTTKAAPSLYMSVPGNTSTSATKLDAVPADNYVYMIVNDNPDFTVNANQQEYAMTLNGTTGEYEISGLTFDANTTKYFTFVYKPLFCGLECMPVNPRSGGRQFLVDKGAVIPGNAYCTGEYISAKTCATVPGATLNDDPVTTEGIEYNWTGATGFVSGGTTRALVEIGGQCWFARNSVAKPTSPIANDPNTGANIWTCCSLVPDNGYWGYYNVDDNQGLTGWDTTENAVGDGLLYQWSAAMNGGTAERAKGVCPTGFHVPSNCEVMYLENSLGMTPADQQIYPGWRGTNQGTRLKQGGTTGFNVKLAGYRGNANGAFDGYGTFGHFLTSTTPTGLPDRFVVVTVSSAEARVFRSDYPKGSAYPLRCVRD